MKAPVAMLRILGLVSRKMNYGAKIVEALNNYPERFESGETWARLGKPETTFKDYILRS
jgi:hypothetical protein